MAAAGAARYTDVPVFDPNDEVVTLTLWRSSFDGFCGTQGIPQEPKNAQHHFFVEPNLRRRPFISALGKRQEAALRLHMWPTLPENRSIPMLVDVLRRQYEPVESCAALE